MDNPVPGSADLRDAGNPERTAQLAHDERMFHAGSGEWAIVRRRTGDAKPIGLELEARDAFTTNPSAAQIYIVTVAGS